MIYQYKYYCRQNINCVENKANFDKFNRDLLAQLILSAFDTLILKKHLTGLNSGSGQVLPIFFRKGSQIKNIFNSDNFHLSAGPGGIPILDPGQIFC